MTTLYENLLGGAISDDPLTSGATTINSTAFANLPVVADPDVMYLTLDPSGANGAPEIVKVTAHASSATSVTVVRAQQDTVGRSHPTATEWVHALTEADIDGFLTSVGTAQIVDAAVTTAKVADDAITEPKLADNAVATASVQNDAITEPKLADGAVATATIQDDAVTEPKLADGAVATASIQDEAVTVAKLAPGVAAEFGGLVTYATSTTDQAINTTEAVSLSVTFTAEADTLYRVTMIEHITIFNATPRVDMRIRASLGGTVYGYRRPINETGTQAEVLTIVVEPGAGEVTFVSTLDITSDTGTANRSASNPAWLLVERLGSS